MKVFIYTESFFHKIHKPLGIARALSLSLSLNAHTLSHSHTHYIYIKYLSPLNYGNIHFAISNKGNVIDFINFTPLYKKKKKRGKNIETLNFLSEFSNKVAKLNCSNYKISSLIFQIIYRVKYFF